jgi:prolipoprotein diacylglyceryltransferase
VLGVAGTGLMRLRSWAWWLALLTVIAVLIWTVVRIVQASGSLHVEWYATVGIAAILFGYLVTVHHFFRRPEVE